MKVLGIAAACLLVLIAVGAGAFELGKHDAPTSTTLSVPTTLPPTTNWTGEYAYVSNNAISPPSDAVLVTLLQSPGGVQGTWTETALLTSDAIALNGTETAVPPSNSFSMTLTRDGASSLSATINNENTPSIEIYKVAGGIELQYLDSGGGTSTVDLYSAGAASSYNNAVQAMDSYCQASSSVCGQS